MLEKTGKILAVDDNGDILTSLKLLFKSKVEKIVIESDPQKIPYHLENETFDVILLDMNFTKDVISGVEGFFWLRKILEIDPTAVVMFITAYGDVERAVRAVKEGATDFVVKPWQNEKLLTTVLAGIKLYRTKQVADSYKLKQQELSASMDEPFSEFIGESEEMMQVFNTITKVAKTDASVLVLGENGTGKELVARALHRNSSRANDVFISVDMGSISETLFESELFGHVKGSFTDARKDRAGRIEIASGGTLFLDEIGNLSLPMQAKLLTVLEKREVIRVGSNKSRPIDIRLICATNMPIHKLAGENQFRQDLLYRVNTVEVQLPPLRERILDIELLANHFLKLSTKKYKKKVNNISTAALRKLEKYNWPGNVRELQHAFERAVIMCDGLTLQPTDFLLRSSDCTSEEPSMETFNLEEAEIRIIRKVLKKNKGNITQAAKELGLTRTSLYRRLEKYGL